MNKLILDAEHPEIQKLAEAMLNNFLGHDAPIIEISPGMYQKGFNPQMELEVKFVTKTKVQTFTCLVTPIKHIE